MATRGPKPTVPEPSEDELEAMLRDHVMDNEVSFETTDGCDAEADGVCYHGRPTWLRYYGLI